MYACGLTVWPHHAGNAAWVGRVLSPRLSWVPEWAQQAWHLGLSFHAHCAKYEVGVYRVRATLIEKQLLMRSTQESRILKNDRMYVGRTIVR